MLACEGVKMHSSYYCRSLMASNEMLEPPDIDVRPQRQPLLINMGCMAEVHFL